MDLFEAIEKRHACRTFDPDKDIDDKLVNKLIEAGKMAPSAGGLQDQRFTVVKDIETKKKIAQSANQEFLSEASVIIVVSSDIKVIEAKYGERGRNLYAAQDVAASVQNIFLAATALGLGACWVGGFDEQKVKEDLKLPGSCHPMTLLPIGYSLEK
jgi:nitroreductase